MKSTRFPMGILTIFAVLVALLGTSTPSGAVVSGANGRILFVSDRDGDKEIFAIRADGTGLVQLTNNTANDYDAAFSGDGSRIAFVSDRDGVPELYTMNASGSAQTRITTNTLTESHPSWAPNNSAIVFAGLLNGKSYIYKIVPNGTHMTRISRDLTAYDTDPAWSPGGKYILFDSIRSGNTGTNIYKMNIDGSGAIQLTTSGTDSNPSWAPDNKTIAFQSSRDNVADSGVCAAANMPVGVAVLSDRVLFTQWNTDKVQQVTNCSGGTVSNFATLPQSGLSTERYLAVSPGLGGFPAGYIYATVGQDTYQISPDGQTVTLFVHIDSMPNGETGITFDTVGTFDYKMILTDRRGPIWLVDSSGNATQFYDLGKQVEGPVVAPMSFTPAPGQLLVGSEFVDQMYAISNTDPPVVSLVGPPRESPEGAIEIPSNVCNMGGSGGAYFVALKDANQLYRFSSGSFIGLSGVLVPSEETTDIDLYGSDGTVTTFSGALGIPELEGSAFAPCTQGGGGAGREIYTMRDDGSQQTRLTTNGTDDIRPAYSADQASIVFQSDRDDPNQPGCEQDFTCKYEIYTMKWDGTNQANLSNNLGANDTSAEWQTVSFSPISIFDDFFTPITAKPPLGGAVLWENYGTDTEGHTVTDNTGMGLFDSGTILPGGFYDRQFGSSGQYPFYCKIHPLMTGTVKVPMTAAPKMGNLTTVFTITWASFPPPSGYRYDVQIQRPGSEFVDWMPNTTKKSSTFVADGGTGTYSFQARIRNTSNGFASNYSPPVTITVNP